MSVCSVRVYGYLVCVVEKVEKMSGTCHDS